MAITATANVASAARKVLLGAGIVAWIVVAAKLLTRELDHPGKLDVAIAVAIVLAPFFVTRIARMPIYLLGAYAALVPFDELLGIGIGASVTKGLAILVGAALVLSMASMRRATLPSLSLGIWAVLTAYVGATIFWAIDPARATAVFGPFLEYVLLLAAMSMYPMTRRDMWVVLGCTIGGALIAAAYGSYAFQTSLSITSDRLLIGYNSDKVIDSNEFAAGLLMPISLVLTFFLRSRFGFVKLLWLLALGLLLTAFVLSGSRGATIGIAALALYTFWRSPYRRQVIAFLAIGLVAIIASPVGQRFAAADVGTGDGRMDIWKVGIASLQQYWLAGAGIGNFTIAYAQYFLATPHQPIQWDRAAHSIFVQSAVEYGLFGFALTMAVWLFAIRELHYVRGDKLVKDICVALSAGIVGLFVAGLSLDLMIYKYTWLAFALVALMRSMLVTTGIPISKPSNMPQSAETVKLEHIPGPAV